MHRLNRPPSNRIPKAMAIQFQHLEQAQGVTRLAGHRIRVLDVDNSRLSGLSPEEIATEYRLPLGAVYEALAYATDHPEEISHVRETEEQILNTLRTTERHPDDSGLP